MTYWEAFTQAKNKENSDSNEDRIVVVDDCLYAVIDGATDKSGQTYHGLTGGQIAGRVLEEVLRKAARDLNRSEELPLAKLFEPATRALARRYRSLGISQTIRQNPWARFSAQATIVIRRQSTYRFIIVGDTGLRLNGSEAHSGPKPGDVICGELRAAVHRHLAKTGMNSEATNANARNYTVEGLRTVQPDMPCGIGSAELGALRREANAACRRRLPDLADEDIDMVLNGGLKGLCRFQNRPGPLGFPCIDGTPIPIDMIVDFERPFAAVNCMELFSDGYGSLPGGTTVADWEAAFWKRERADPERVTTHPDTKGSTPQKFADDRTVLIVRPRPEAGN